MGCPINLCVWRSSIQSRNQAGPPGLQSCWRAEKVGEERRASTIGAGTDGVVAVIVGGERIRRGVNLPYMVSAGIPRSIPGITLCSPGTSSPFLSVGISVLGFLGNPDASSEQSLPESLASGNRTGMWAGD